MALMSVNNNPPSLRYRAYLIALPLTSTAVIATYLIELRQGRTDPFNLMVLPSLALLLGLITVGHTARLLNPRTVEISFSVISALAYFGKLGFTLLGPYSPSEQAHELSQVYIWTPFIYALAFLTGSPRASLLRAGGVYLIGTGVGLAAALSRVPLEGF